MQTFVTPWAHAGWGQIPRLVRPSPLALLGLRFDELYGRARNIDAARTSHVTCDDPRCRLRRRPRRLRRCVCRHQQSAGGAQDAKQQCALSSEGFLIQDWQTLHRSLPSRSSVFLLDTSDAARALPVSLKIPTPPEEGFALTVPSFFSPDTSSLHTLTRDFFCNHFHRSAVLI